MSDRTPSSVRTGDRAGEAADGAAAPESGGRRAEVSATQSIPTTGTQRAQGGDTVGTPPVAPGAVPGAGRAPAAPPPAPAAGGAPPAAGVAAPSAGAMAAGTRGAPAGAPRAGRPAGAKPGGKAGRGPRRARLQLRHVDIWSAFKISLVLSVALFCIWMVAIGILYGVLNGLGVFRTLNDLFGQLGSAAGGKKSGAVVTPGIVLLGAAIVGAINVVLMTALCTVGTFIYNMCADLVGGLEVTLSERD